MIIDCHGHHTAAPHFRRHPALRDALELAPGARAKVFERDARRVYPRLDAALTARRPQADGGSSGSEPGARSATGAARGNERG